MATGNNSIIYRRLVGYVKDLQPFTVQAFNKSLTARGVDYSRLKYYRNI